MNNTGSTDVMFVGLAQNKYHWCDGPESRIRMHLTLEGQIIAGLL